MCLIVFAWQTHRECSLVVAANRDEWRERPTARLHWWDHEAARIDSEYSQEIDREHSQSTNQQQTGILAGRDLQDGGTWMGVSAAGRFAALTNFRDPRSIKPAAPSRGRLVTDFLSGTATARDHVATLTPQADAFNGFNLLVSDGKELWWLSNRGGDPSALSPGIYGVSNGLLDEPWPKVVRAKERLWETLSSGSDESALWTMLADDAAAPDNTLPDTGVGLDWERRLSPALIVGDRYGTRSSSLLFMRPDGGLRCVERTWPQQSRELR